MKPSRLFALVMPEARLVESASYAGDHNNVVVSEIASEQHTLATSLMECLGYSLNNTAQEQAAFGTLEFTTAPVTQLELADDLLDETDSGDSTEVALDSNSGSDTSSIDGSPRRLRVLVDAEGHKFADKIFGTMLGNTEDLSGKAQFLIDLDTFLFTHRNTDADDDAEETASAVTDLPWMLLVETARAAREKTGRALVLSHLMRAMNTSVGERVVAAFEAADANALEEAIVELGEAMKQQLPEDETDSTSDDDDLSEDTDESSDPNPNPAKAPSGEFDEI